MAIDAIDSLLKLPFAGRSMDGMGFAGSTESNAVILEMPLAKVQPKQALESSRCQD